MTIDALENGGAATAFPAIRIPVLKIGNKTATPWEIIVYCCRVEAVGYNPGERSDAVVGASRFLTQIDPSQEGG
jgi:hypothetical protein